MDDCDAPHGPGSAEIARKFTADELVAELERTGMEGCEVWTDDDGDFGLVLAEVR